MTVLEEQFLFIEAAKNYPSGLSLAVYFVTL